MSLLTMAALSARRHRPKSGVTARFWKLNILSTVANDSYINCALIGLNRVAGDKTNQCPSVGGTSTASSVYGSGYLSINAWNEGLEDGTAPAAGSSFWHSNSQAAPWWTIFDCGVGKSITASELALQGANIVTRMPSSFQLLTSNDGTAWNLVAAYSGISSWVAHQVRFFAIPSP